ncbi:hypothetical protein O181_064390 [Austropuccinia psidii MF-1]|uniref:Uncharacterized protein n=1 Tax=Austropuccinia psidii MF-1 TaxID=1389203 RepID=A0A9Q3ET26_9BASI|nr:hypothetical protein [Austropuccinia psidii MF-1]
MEGAAPFRRGGMKSRRSRSFSGLLGDYPGMSEGARARLGEVEDEEGEESVEEEDSGSHHKKKKKGKQFRASSDKPHSSVLNKANKLIGSEKERRIKAGLCTYCGGKHQIEICFKRPQNKPGSSRGFPRKQGKA